MSPQQYCIFKSRNLNAVLNVVLKYKLYGSKIFRKSSEINLLRISLRKNRFSESITWPNKYSHFLRMSDHVGVEGNADI